MKEPTYVITYDVGTTGVKTCLFEIGEVVRLTAAAMRGYELYVLPDGGAEQEPAEWWEAMCASTREVLDASGMDPTRISGVSFCSQMQGVVLVDKERGAGAPRDELYGPACTGGAEKGPGPWPANRGRKCI